MSLIGLDLGGTKLSSAIMTEEGEVILGESTAIGKCEGSSVGALMADKVRRLIAEQKGRGDEVRSIGICIPGISRQVRGTVWAPNIPGWDDYPLLEEIKAVASGIPVAIDSDRACSILGESWKGAAIGCRDAIFLAVGTGIGAGILIDGKVLRGSYDVAGAIGWMALERPFVESFQRSGNFESVASGSGIARLAGELLAGNNGYHGPLALIPEDKLSARDVFEAYDEDDPIAKEIFRRCVELWGMAVANLISLFNPEKIILGGGVFGPAIQFIPEIRTEAAKWAQPISIKLVTIEASSLGRQAALIGTGLLAMQNLAVR